VFITAASLVFCSFHASREDLDASSSFFRHSSGVTATLAAPSTMLWKPESSVRRRSSHLSKPWGRDFEVRDGCGSQEVQGRGGSAFSGGAGLLGWHRDLFVAKRCLEKVLAETLLVTGPLFCGLRCPYGALRRAVRRPRHWGSSHASRDLIEVATFGIEPCVDGHDGRASICLVWSRD